MNPMAKLTMYDMLTILVAGFLLCSGICLYIRGNIPGNDISFWVICYIVGLVYHRLLDAIFEKCKLRNKQEWIEKAHSEVQEENPGKLSPDSSKQAYYVAYYHLVKNNSLGNIPVLEAQVALLRNLVLILSAYNMIACYRGFCIYETMNYVFLRWGCGIVISLIIPGVLCYVWYFTQMKIHKLVWEGSCFINDKEGNKEN